MDKEEIEKKYEYFKEHHPNGKLSKESFREIMSQAYPNVDTVNMQNHIFRMYDYNNDGYIDFREFMILLYIMCDAPIDDNLGQIFRLVDINNDGAINRAELKRLAIDLYKMTNVENIDEKTQALNAQKAFNEMDENMDGKVDVGEFKAAIWANKEFSKMLTRKMVEVFVA